MMYTFYWYPKCSTCRKAKAVLDQRGIKYEAIDLKATPPQASDFQKWFENSEFPVKKYFNTSGLVYRALGLKDKLAEMTSDECVTVLASDGMLIKRPLMIRDGKVVSIGFKEEFYQNEL